MTDIPPLPADNQISPPERFWTWDMKALLAINIIFLLLIAGGVITILAALSPTIYHYVLGTFS
jgi:hypothetical protein